MTGIGEILNGSVEAAIGRRETLQACSPIKVRGRAQIPPVPQRVHIHRLRRRLLSGL
jgi:hypothetical protein